MSIADVKAMELAARADAVAIGSPALPLIDAAIAECDAALGDAPSWPAWRRAIADKDVMHALPGTRASLLAAIGACYDGAVAGLHPIFGWNGYALATDALLLAAASGHYQSTGPGWHNFAFRLDLAADALAWAVDFAGSRLTIDANGLLDAQGRADIAHPYYPDLRPCGRHTYQSAIAINARHRVALFGSMATAGQDQTPWYKGGPQVDTYDWLAHDYDKPASVDAADSPYIPRIPFTEHIGGNRWTPEALNLYVPSVAKHPDTEDVYWTSSEGFFKWAQATNLWSRLTLTNSTSATRYWWYRGSCVDRLRGSNGAGRWFTFQKNNSTGAWNVVWIDLGNAYRVDTMPLSGAIASLGALGDSHMVHDLDSDRYVYVGGTGSNGTQTTKMCAINPDSGVVSEIATVYLPVNGCHTRLQWSRKYGGLFYWGRSIDDMQFMATRLAA